MTTHIAGTLIVTMQAIKSIGGIAKLPYTVHALSDFALPAIFVENEGTDIDYNLPN